MLERTCLIQDCEDLARTRGWCRKHYERWRRYGSPLAPVRVYRGLGRRTSLEERFWAKVNKEGPVPEHCPERGPCWPWTGALNSCGYGNVRIGGRNHDASRIALELTSGPLAPGHSALHHCDNRPCCNPAHLYAGTKADNMRDYLARGKDRW